MAVPQEAARRVLRYLATVYGTSPGGILAEDKSKSRSTARHVTVWVLKQALDMSFPELGRLLQRHNTTAWNSFHRVEQHRERDPSFRAWTDSLVRHVRERRFAVAEVVEP